MSQPLPPTYTPPAYEPSPTKIEWHPEVLRAAAWVTFTLKAIWILIALGFLLSILQLGIGVAMLMGR
jgi:hypothetical protein